VPLIGERAVYYLTVVLALVIGAGCGRNDPPANEETPPVAAPAAATAPAHPQRNIRSAFYNFTLTTYAGLVPPPDRQRAGGSVTPLGDGFLLVTAAGDFFRLSWQPGGDAISAERVPLSAPFNRTELLSKTTPELAAPFRITDLLVDERSGTPRIYVAHHNWNSADNCITLRVSSTTLAPAGSPVAWTTVFDSRPCLTVGDMWATGEAADRGGGRLALDGQGRLLLSVGDYGFEGLNDKPAYPQLPDVSYGKILLLDMGGGAAPFSLGHRNPQGLFVDNQGRVWSTEHGPEGGDELNLVVRGGNYGWPLATYGTAYDSDVWPLATDPGSHGRFREPAEAFVPSVGISQLLQVGSKYVPRWAGDLLVSSLQAATLFRVHLAGDRVVYTERLDVSTRVRDIAEGQDGRILIWNDNGEVASLTLAR
jgi:aldose sugar dehydrogenase